MLLKLFSVSFRTFAGSLEVASHLTGRRVCSLIFRILILKGFEFLEKHVEFEVAQDRRVVYIVFPVRLNDYFLEFLYSDICLRLVHRL